MKCEDCKFYEFPEAIIFYSAGEIDEMIKNGLTEQEIQARCIKEHSMGECLRYPPVFIDEDNSGFPVTFRDSWCGEFVRASDWSLFHSELTVRAANILDNSQIDSFEKLIRYSKTDLLKKRSCGKRTVRDIVRRLRLIGLKLKDD